MVFWRTGSRNHVLIPLSVYVLILIVTSIYFVPQLMDITGTAFSEAMDATLTSRAKTWETLSLVRLGVLVVIAVYLFLGMNKARDLPVR